MSLPTNFLKEINEFSNFYIEFDNKHIKYKLNGTWVDEIENELFLKQVDSLRRELIFTLQKVENRAAFLKDVFDVLHATVNLFQEYTFLNLKVFEKLNNLIVTSNDNSAYIVKEKIAFDDVMNHADENTEEISDYLFFLLMLKSETNRYQNPQDFEKAKLLYILKQYFDSLKSLLAFIKELYVNVSLYDLKYFDNYVENSKVSDSKMRCVINFSKINTAAMFNLLLNSKVVFFDKDNEVKNRDLLEQFINENFAYVNGRNKNKIVNIQSNVKEIYYLKYK